MNLIEKNLKKIQTKIDALSCFTLWQKDFLKLVAWCEFTNKIKGYNYKIDKLKERYSLNTDLDIDKEIKILFDKNVIMLSTKRILFDNGYKTIKIVKCNPKLLLHFLTDN